MGKASFGVPEDKKCSPTDAEEYLVIDSDEHELLEEAPYQNSRPDGSNRKCWIGWLVGLVAALLLAAIILISVNFCLNQKDVSRTRLSHYSGPAGQVGQSTTDEPNTVVEDRLPDLVKDKESDIHINKDSSNESGGDNDMSQDSKEDQPNSDVPQTDQQFPDLMLGVFKEMVNGINNDKSNPLPGLGDLDKYGTTNSPNYYKYGYYNYDYDGEYDDHETWPDDSDESYEEYQYGTTPGTNSWPESYVGSYYGYDYEEDKGNDNAWYTTTAAVTSWSQYYGKDYFYDDDDVWRDDDDEWRDDYSSEQANEGYDDAEYVTTPAITAWPQYIEDTSYDDDSIWSSDSSEELDNEYYDDLWDMTTPDSSIWMPTQDWYGEDFWPEPADYEEGAKENYDYSAMGMPNNMTHFASSLANIFNKVMDKADSESQPVLDGNESDEVDSGERSSTTEWLYRDLAMTPESQKAGLDSDQQDGDVYDDESVSGSADEEMDYYPEEEYYGYSY